MLLSQPVQEIDSRIAKVTVYQEGAQIVRTASAELPAGETVLAFSGLPEALGINSLQFSATGEVMLMSISEVMEEPDQAAVDSTRMSLQNEQLALRDSLGFIDRLQKVYERERELLLSNKAIGGQDGVPISELRAAAELFRDRLTDIEQQQQRLRQVGKGLKRQIMELGQALLDLDSRNQAEPTKQLRLLVSTDAPLSSALELRYVLPDAGWTPSYDLRIMDTESPLDLAYKAKVFQSTGEDWAQVELRLSTGNPSISNVKPELPVYYLMFNNTYAPPRPASAYGPVSGERLVRGTIVDQESGEPLIGATLLIKGTSIGTVTDVNGQYELLVPAGSSILLASYVGFANQEVNIGRQSVADIRLSSSGMMLDEVVVMERQQINQSASIPKKEAKRPLPVAVEKSRTSTNFDIEIPYSIPSDNKPYDVRILSYEVPAAYHYSLVPKLSNQAYLIAKIGDWQAYNLLNGQANLFLKGIYQGTTYLDLAAFEDSLSFSVGRDEDIIVKREISRDFTRERFFGSTKTVERAWTIELRNNNTYPVDLKVEDQYPLPKSDDIKVDRIAHSGAVLEEDTGKLVWELLLQPGESKKLDLRYAVRYPKKERLLVE